MIRALAGPCRPSARRCLGRLSSRIRHEERSAGVVHRYRSIRDSSEEGLTFDPSRRWFDVPGGDFRVDWDALASDDLEAFDACLQRATSERELQTFFAQRPMILGQLMLTSWERVVIPSKRLGAEHVTDFMLGGMGSDGPYWTAIELESPKAKLFTKKGDPTAILTHAIRQIQDWRSWLLVNQNYAARSGAHGGLGLMDVRPDVEGLIILGRRDENHLSTQRLRRQMASDLRIHLHSYEYVRDRLVDQLRYTEAADIIQRRNRAQSSAEERI